MYSILPSFVLAFHGCDKKVVDKVINKHENLRVSQNKYDWLANGTYFWENNPHRALSYAKSIKKRPERVKGKVHNPAVIGEEPDLLLRELDRTVIESIHYKL